MVFNCTKRFRDNIISLTTRPKDNYGSVRNDIKSAFGDLSFEALFSLPICMRQINKSRLIKIRLSNSGASIGSSGGFRLIYIANPNNQTITLCHVFPKRGKYAKQNVTGVEVAEILNELFKEMSDNLLTEPEFLVESPKSQEQNSASLDVKKFS